MKEARIWFAGDTNDNTVAWTVVKATVWPWHWGESLQPMSERLPRFGICNVVRILWHRDNAWYLCREAHFWWAQRWSRKKDKTAARETLAWFSIGDFSISAANLMVLPIPVYVIQYSWYCLPKGPLYLSLSTFQQAMYSINRQLFVFAIEGSKHLYIKNCAFRKTWWNPISGNEVEAAFCYSCGHSIEYHSLSNNSRGECSFEECDCRNYLDQEVIPQLEDIDR